MLAPLSPKEKRGEVDQGESTGCAVPVPACLLVCQLRSWTLSLGEFVHFHLHWAKSLSFSSMVPQQCLVLSKLQGERSEQTPGRKVALSLWPGSPHGVRCVSLLHYTLPASAGGANSPGTPGLAGLNGAVRCLKLCSMSVLALFFSLGLMLSNTHAHSHNIVPILPPPPKLSH